MSRLRNGRNLPQPVPCLFCATPCPPTFCVVDGQVERLKNGHQKLLRRRNEGNSVSEAAAPRLGLFEEEEKNSPGLAAQLKSVFILKKILSVGEDKLIKFLEKMEGQLLPEFWVQTCQPCGDAVKICFETLREIARLESKFAKITERLRNRVVETQGEDGAGIVADESNPLGSIWKDVRDHVLKGN